MSNRRTVYGFGSKKDSQKTVCRHDRKCAKIDCRYAHSSLQSNREVQHYNYCTLSRTECTNPDCELNHMLSSKRRYICKYDKTCKDSKCPDLHSNHTQDSRVRIETFCKFYASACHDPKCVKNHEIYEMQEQQELQEPPTKKRGLDEKIIQLFDSEQALREENEQETPTKKRGLDEKIIQLFDSEQALREENEALRQEIETLKGTIEKIMPGYIQFLINNNQ